MRCFVTCLLLFCFQAFVVCTIEDGSVTFVQDFNFNPKQTKVDKIVAEQAPNLHIVKAAYQLSDISHHQLNKHLSHVINSIENDKIVFTHWIKKITELSNSYNYSYNFIFKCLYPKHNFW